MNHIYCLVVSHGVAAHEIRRGSLVLMPVIYNLHFQFLILLPCRFSC